MSLIIAQNPCFVKGTMMGQNKEKRFYGYTQYVESYAYAQFLTFV